MIYAGGLGEYKDFYLMCRVYHIFLNFDREHFIAAGLGCAAAIRFDYLFDMVIRSGLYQF